MIRRLSWLLVLSALPLLALAAEPQQFKEGTDYAVIDPPLATSSGDKVEVIEAFFYGCPHCYQLLPLLDRWRPEHEKDIDFKYLPVIFQPSWALYAQAYYAADALGVVDKIHEPLFRAIHAEKRPLGTAAALADFFAEHGVPREDFYGALHSFAVSLNVSRAQDMTKRYGITGVPSLIVDGRYRTSASLAGTHQKALQVVSFLIDKVKAERAKEQQGTAAPQTGAAADAAQQ
jgi:thiol:disulfide interchange protein DsbA